jgi:hypothetical protein
MTSVIRLEWWLPVCLLILGMGNSAGQAAAPKKSADKAKVKLPALLSAKPLKVHPKDDALRKLLKARYNEAVSEAREHYIAEPSDDSRLSRQDSFYSRWGRVVKAGLALCDKPADKVALLKKYLDLTKVVERAHKEGYDLGRTTKGDLNRARYERLDAEIRLLRAKREAGRAKGK